MKTKRNCWSTCIVQMETETGLDRNAALADMRYSFIENVVCTLRGASARRAGNTPAP